MSSPAVLSSQDSHDTTKTTPDATVMPHNSLPPHSSQPAETRESSQNPEPGRENKGKATPTRSSTPSAPSYSPLTPPLPDATSGLPSIPPIAPLSPNSRKRRRPSSRNSQPVPPTEIITTAPPPVPISEDTNPDVIALRAALDVLQLQRLRALRNITSLRETKERALGDPQGFARSLERGELSAEHQGQVYELRVPDLGDGDAEGEGEDGEGADEDPHAEAQTGRKKEGRFDPLPEAQDVARCPPVNWAKYHVVGEALDRLHEEQRVRPGDGLGPEHAILAPYRPFVDRLEQTGKGMQRKRGGRCNTGERE